MSTFSVSVRGIELGVCSEEIERYFKKVAPHDLPLPREAQSPQNLNAERDASCPLPFLPQRQRPE